MFDKINNKINKEVRNGSFYYLERSYFIDFKKRLNSEVRNINGEFKLQLLCKFFFSKKSLKKLANIVFLIFAKIYAKFFAIAPNSTSINNFSNIIVGFKTTNSNIDFIKCNDPVVSIVIPVYNQLDYTFNCLRSLMEHVSNDLQYEVIVINDKSTDATELELAKIEGLILINNNENLGFIRSCNKGASVAKGKYICFLNNDTIVQKSWLEELHKLLEKDNTIGIVGSMLIYPNGVLQEAGGIIWNDASGWNYGRNQNRFAPSYNFVREVDYVSGASLMISKKDFDTLNGFDELFLPAYYEDTDLCFSVRNRLGKKVVYTPFSQVVHFEGITSGIDLTSGIKQYQRINHTKFFNKWSLELSKYHLPNHHLNVFNASNRNHNSRILIIDSYIPCYNKESGSNRLFQIIKIFNNLGYQISFLPDNGVAEQPYTRELQEMGVDVMYRNINYFESLAEQILEKLNTIDVVWICRPELFEKYSPFALSNAKIKIIYDTIDLHFLRLKREEELFPEKKTNWELVKKTELYSANISSKTIAITEFDKKVLTELGIGNVSVIPNIHNIANSKNALSFSERKNLLFIGGYNHTPNVDAVVWLVNEIMPKVWEVLPDVQITLLGSNPNHKVLELAGDKVHVTGFIDDVSNYFHTHRVFVAPLRYGAGMKGKIGQSLEFGLPIVSTSIGVEGMGLKSDENILVADETDAFAQQIIKLYSNQEVWTRIQQGSNDALKPFTSEAIEIAIKDLMSELS